MAIALPPFVRFYLTAPTISDELISACSDIPGVKIVRARVGNRKRIPPGSIEGVQSPVNAAWRCEQIFAWYKTPYTLWNPKVEVRETPQSLIACGIRTHDPDSGLVLEDFLNAYQKREIFKWIDRPGVLFQWPTGAGKSIGGLMYSVATPGPIVILTGAKGRGSWSYQIKRFTTLKSYTIYGEVYTEDIDVATNMVRSSRDREGIKADRVQIEQILAAGSYCSCMEKHETRVVRKYEEGPEGSDGRMARCYVRFTLPPGVHTVQDGRVLTVKPPEIPEDARFVICSWESLPAHVDKLAALQPRTLILDEPHRAKSHKRYKKIPVTSDQLATTADARLLPDGSWARFVPLGNTAECTQRLRRQSERCILLSATPIKDRVRDLWALLDYLDPGAFGNYHDFSARYCGGHSNVWGGWNDKGSSNLEELHARSAFYISYVSEEESKANLPPLRREPVFLAPELLNAVDPEFAAELKEAEAAVISGRGQPQSIAEIRLAAACSRKRKVICDEFVELVNEGKKVIVFTSRRRDVAVMKELVEKRLDKGARCWTGDGGTPAGCPGSQTGAGKDACGKCRDCIRIAYMAAPSHAGLIATGYSFGEQIDLNDTDILIVAALPWTITDLIQWIGRVHRQGGTRNVLVKLMIAEGTYDERVASILLDKLPAIMKLGTEGAAGLRESLVGDQDELLRELAAEIMQGVAA